MSDHDAPGDKHPGTTTDSTETPLAETLAAAQAELDRLERQAAADDVEIDYADGNGRVSILLRYHDLGGAD